MIINYKGVPYALADELSTENYDISLVKETGNEAEIYHNFDRYSESRDGCRFTRDRGNSNIGVLSCVASIQNRPLDSLLGSTIKIQFFFQCHTCDKKHQIKFTPKNVSLQNICDNFTFLAFSEKSYQPYPDNGFAYGQGVRNESEKITTLILQMMHNFEHSLRLLIHASEYQIMQTVFVCNDCADSHFFCDRCEDVIHDAYYDGDYDCCSSCRPECSEDEECDCQNCNRGAIQNYSFKPAPLFSRTDKEVQKHMLVSSAETSKTRYFAFELETATENLNWADCTYRAEDLIDRTDGIYCKADCSIEPIGFEIVTHPFTFPFLLENKDKLITPISRLMDEDFKSYNNNTCGMHVHVSKKSVTNYQIHKLLNLLYQNPQLTLALSRRRSIQNLREWASPDTEFCEPKQNIQSAKGKFGGVRYNALNLQNYNSIEFRIFRGTLRADSIVMNLEIVKALLDFTDIANHGTTEILPSTFKQFLLKGKKDYPNINNTFFKSATVNRRFNRAIKEERKAA